MHTYVFKHSCPHYLCNEPHIWLFVFLMAAQCCGRQTYGRHSDTCIYYLYVYCMLRPPGHRERSKLLTHTFAIVCTYLRV